MPQLTGIFGAVTPPGRLNRALDWALQAARERDPSLETRLINLAGYRLDAWNACKQSPLPP